MAHGAFWNISEHPGTWNNYHNYEKNMQNQILSLSQAPRGFAAFLPRALKLLKNRQATQAISAQRRVTMTYSALVVSSGRATAERR